MALWRIGFMKKLVVMLFAASVVGLSSCNLNRAKPVEEMESSETASANLGTSLARSALNGSQGYSAGRCYEFVWGAFRRVFGYNIENTSVPERSAYQFGDWADRNPNDLARVFQLKRSSVYPEKAPVGSVIVWNPGQCGYNSTHGHIEIAVGGGRACSDFCGQIKTTCANPRVYVPASSSSLSFSSAEVAAKSPISCGPKMISICIKSKGGVASCNRKYSCKS
jgi:hypothetical protein